MQTFHFDSLIWYIRIFLQNKGTIKTGTINETKDMNAMI